MEYIKKRDLGKLVKENEDANGNIHSMLNECALSLSFTNKELNLPLILGEVNLVQRKNSKTSGIPIPKLISTKSPESSGITKATSPQATKLFGSAINNGHEPSVQNTDKSKL